MFDDIIVVQSAISAFNNAALHAPAFLWWAILSIPLMAIVWKCAPMIQNTLSWTPENKIARIGVTLSAVTFLWAILFGGNYNVLRDNVSVLPFVTALIVFLTSLFVSSHMRHMPNIFKNKKLYWLAVVFIILALGFSDTHTWWGPLLQIGSFGFGMIMGRIAGASMRPVAGMVTIMLILTVAMLMQPEFFRFGQLGNLTIAHLLFILMIGACGMAVIALNNVNPRGKIHTSAFSKLKWLMRVICILTTALFILTESVPLFLATCGALLIMFSLSIYHQNKIPEHLMDKLLAILIILFGTIICVPFISALGILYLATLPQGNFKSEIRVLL